MADILDTKNWRVVKDVEHIRDLEGAVEALRITLAERDQRLSKQAESIRTLHERLDEADGRIRWWQKKFLD